MGYSESAMISVLQKAEIVTRNRKDKHEAPDPIDLNGIDEQDCCHIAVRYGFAKKFHEDMVQPNCATLTYSGVLELDRLHKVKKAEEKDRRKMRLERITVAIAILSLTLSVITFGTVAIDRYFVPPRPQPIRVEGGRIELLVNEALLATNRNKTPQTSKTNTEACPSRTNIQKDQ